VRSTAVCRKEATMEDKRQPIGAGETARTPAAVSAPSGRPPSWVILLGASLVAFGVFGPQRPAAILAKGDGAPGEAKRSEQAQTPSRSSGRGWKDILLRAYQGISDDRIMLIAAGVTYYAILALFPGIGAIVAIYGLFADPGSIAAHLDTLSGVAPAGAVGVLRDQLMRLAHQNRAALGFSFAVSLVIALWSANAGVSGLFEALTAVYEEKEKRSLVKYYATTLAFTAGIIVLVLLSLVILIVLPLVLDHIAHPGVPPVLLKIIRWPILFVLIVLALSVIYRYGPSRSAPRWRWITWGSAFAAVAWLAVSALFSWYVANFGSYDKTYGSLGAIIGFLTWLWLSIVVVLVGARLDAELQRREEADRPASLPEAPHPKAANALGSQRL
jgi:membrane protein